MTSALKHINIPGLVTANCTRIDQRGLGSHRAVFRDASISVPGNGFDDAGIQMRLFFKSAMCSLSPFGFNVMHIM